MQKNVLPLLPPELRRAAEGLDFSTLEELRLRAGRQPGAVFAGRERPLTAPPVTRAQLEQLVGAASGHSSFAALGEGFLTLPGGHRLGFCGEAVVKEGRIASFRTLSSVNLRIARGKTVPLPQELTAALRGHFIGMLLVGEPGSGKTTLLRSIARELVRQQKILSVIDERRELFAGNAPGEALDVLAGLPKGQAVQMALRSLSPQVILLDELGGLDEVTALEQGLFSGVDFIATLHAATPEEATMRPQVKYLMERGAVRVLVWLTGRQAPGCIGEVRFL